MYDMTEIENETWAQIEQELYMKRCNTCGEIKSIDEFYWHKKRKEFYGMCKSCCLNKDANWTKEHPERVKQIAKRNAQSFAKYDSFADKLWADEVRHDLIESKYLQVRCKKCGKWMWPTINQCLARIQAINNIKCSEGTQNNFYCSDKCKNECSIYRKTSEQLIKEDKIRAGLIDEDEESRWMQSWWANEIKERDDHQCQICGNNENPIAHHIEPVKVAPHKALDFDNGITLCKDCHKHVHSLPECDLGYLRNCVLKTA